MSAPPTVRLVRRSDEAQFEALAADASGQLLRFCYVLTRDWQLAEDLLQTSLITTWRHWNRIQNVEAAPAYLRTVICHTHARWWRRKWRNEQPFDVLPNLAGPDATTQVDDRDLLHSALLALPARQRTALALRFFADLSEQQTADAMSCSIGTVKSTTARALARLRELGVAGLDASEEVAGFER